MIITKKNNGELGSLSLMHALPLFHNSKDSLQRCLIIVPAKLTQGQKIIGSKIFSEGDVIVGIRIMEEGRRVRVFVVQEERVKKKAIFGAEGGGGDLVVAGFKV